jgi:hypothetical protein
MAKKDSGKKKKDKKGSGAADTVDAVRSAVERALPDGSKERGAQIVDEVAKAVMKVRESLEQHGVLDELGKLRHEVESLARRVANLEKPTAAKPAATRAGSTATRSKASRSTSTRKPAATRSRSTSAKSTASKSATTRKPAASRSRSTSSKRSSTRSRGSGSSSSS